MRSTDILIVDDEIGIREVLKETLEDEGYTVALAENIEEARQLRNKIRPSMVLLDIWLPDGDGITLLKEWSANGLLTMSVVMMSGHGSIETAVEATKFGALDYLEKPITLQKLLQSVENALQHTTKQHHKSSTLDNLGKASSIQTLKEQLKKTSDQFSPIFLIGEIGSPFEMIARAVHKPNTPWVYPKNINNLHHQAVELLNQTHLGVLYLGDISKYDASIQQSIAQLIPKAIKHHTRIIFCSTKPLNELFVNNKNPQFLNVLASFVINIPPLRHHSEDIEHFIHYIVQELHQSKNIAPTHFRESAMAQLCQYTWPGNWEQLKNIVTNLVLNSETHEIGEREVSQLLSQFRTDDEEDAMHGDFDFDLPLRELRELIEKRYFEYHIRKERGNMSHVALKVGLERTHLYRKLKQLGIYFSRRSEK